MAKHVSDRTKQCRKRKHLFNILHLLCLFGPLLFFVPYGYITGGIVGKIGMSFTVIVSIILTIISILVSVTARAGIHRVIMWTLILGVMMTIDRISGFICVMAFTSILDELIFCRLKDHYSAALISNKEIDRRA